LLLPGNLAEQKNVLQNAENDRFAELYLKIVVNINSNTTYFFSGCAIAHAFVSGITPRRQYFDPRSGHVGFLMEKHVRGRVLPASSRFINCSIFINHPHTRVNIIIRRGREQHTNRNQ
jgi:hypothetical protein